MRFRLSPSVYDPANVIDGIEINEITDMPEFDIKLDGNDSGKLLIAVAPFVLMENAPNTGE